MAEIQHSQIRTKLLEQIVPHLEIEAASNLAGEEAQVMKLSRAVSAAALCALADISPENAASCVVDGSKDNGIDSFYFDQTTKTLFIVQSKWNTSHTASIDVGDTLKFIQGVKDLATLKKDRFNNRIQKRWKEIEGALDDAVKIILVLAYSGSGRLSDEVKNTIDDYVAENNDTSELFFYKVVSQKELFKHFLASAAAASIDLSITLLNYGNKDQPLKAVYGQVSVGDVFEWFKSHGDELFAGNIRHFLGSKTDVNSGISDTLNKRPEYFWYFNNGITILAEKIHRKAVGGADRAIGTFDCTNVRIVNGAQTVGSIGTSANPAELSGMVMLRIIEIEDSENTIGKEVTRASNTQNRISARNFVALDNNQARIRTELMLDSVKYEYLEGETSTDPKNGFEFVEAITSLACASVDVNHAALAKGYVSGLYLDVNTTPYKVFFNNGTNARYVWSIVKLTRRIDNLIKSLGDADNTVQRGIMVNGNRFFTHVVLQNLTDGGHDLNNSDSIDAVTLEKYAKLSFSSIEKAFSTLFPDNYPAPLYKNATKCKLLKAEATKVFVSFQHAN